MAYAIHEVNEKGYGIVTPGIDDLILDNTDTSLVHGMNINPNRVTGITPANALRLIEQYKQR